MIKSTTKYTRETMPPATLKQVCDTLYTLRKRRNMYQKSRVAMHNRTLMQVATVNGYTSGMEEKDRKKAMKEAARVWKAVVAGEETHPLDGLILIQDVAVRGISKYEGQLARAMAKELGKVSWVVNWVEHMYRKGISLEGLALIIGETGDLYNYPNVAKLHRRMCVAPYYCERLDRTHMGCTWRRLKLLTKSEWAEYGYSPRRRSIMYMAATNMLKQNFEDNENEVNGYYRRIYLDIKEKKTQQWQEDTKPDGKNGHAHNHAMLIVGRQLLTDCWAHWTGSKFIPWKQRKSIIEKINRERAEEDQVVRPADMLAIP